MKGGGVKTVIGSEEALSWLALRVAASTASTA